MGRFKFGKIVYFCRHNKIKVRHPSGDGQGRISWFKFSIKVRQGPDQLV